MKKTWKPCPFTQHSQLPSRFFFSKLTAMFSMVHENINKKGGRLVSSRNNKENLQIPTSSNLHINTVTNFDFTLTNYSIKILVF